MDSRDYLWRRLGAELTPITRFHAVPYRPPATEFAVTTSDGVAIAGTHICNGQRSVLIICHGFGDHHHSVLIVWLAEQLAHWHDIIAFDWRGYKLSGGLASFGGDESRDLQAVTAYARERYAAVGLIGDSMGGMICLTAQAAYHLADRLATMGAPADYALTGWPRPQLMERLAPHPAARTISLPVLGIRLGIVSRPQPLDTVAAIAVPLLLIHGDRDRTVPVANAYALIERAGPQARLSIFAGCGHALGSIRRKVPARLLAELRQHFAPLNEQH